MYLFGVNLFGRTDPPNVRAAMENHRKRFPLCEACGAKKVDIHHIIPVAVDSSVASDGENLISLCHQCHISHGHAGDGGCHRYVRNVREVLSSRKIERIT